MSYQSVPTTAYQATSMLDGEDDAFEVEFDRRAGYNYLCIVPSVFLPCCAPLFALVAKKNMAAQKCKITDRRVVFESGWLDHSNKNIPLDRIQDVNVRQDCIQKCFNVKTIEVQTAGLGGSDQAEAQLIAPVDAMIVRDVIMDRRDALVLGHPGVQVDEMGPKPRAKHLEAAPSNAEVVAELQTIKYTLSRLEAHVKLGVEHLSDKNTEASLS